MNPKKVIHLIACLGIISGLAFGGPADELSLGKELKKKGEKAAAAALFLRAARSGECPEAYVLLGLCYEELDRKSNAIWAYAQVSGDRRHGASAIYYMAQLYLAEKRYIEAARIFLSVEKHHPNSNWANPSLVRAGWCLEQAGKKRRAYETYLRALDRAERDELREELKRRIKKLGYYVPRETTPEDGNG